MPMFAFLAQFTRTFGVINQVYFVQDQTLGQCAYECILPEVDNINKTIGTCCRAPGSKQYDHTVCDALGIDLNVDNSDAIYYVQDPFNHQCLAWIDYCVIVTACIPMFAVIVFSLWAGYYTLKFGPRGVRHYVNAIIDMGFPKDMNALHFSAYYGDIEYVRSVIKRADISVDDAMKNGNTALHLAAQNGFSEICYILVKEFNGEIDLRNNENYTAADLARIEGYELIYRYLTKKMDDKRKCKANVTRSKSVKYNSKGPRVEQNPIWSPLPSKKSNHKRMKSAGAALMKEVSGELRQRPTTLALTNEAFEFDNTFRDTFDRDTKTTHSTTLDSFTDIDQNNKNALPFILRDKSVLYLIEHD